MRNARLAFAICAGLIFLLPRTSNADDAYVPKIVPQCKVYWVKGKRICGYDRIEDVQRLHEIDAEVIFTRMQVKNLMLSIGEYKGQVRGLQLALAARADSIRVLQDRNHELTLKLLDTDRKFQLERAKPRWGTAISWGTAGILGAALVGFVGAVVLD